MLQEIVFFLSCCCITASPRTNDSMRCGQTPLQAVPRISGGVFVPPYRFPWTCSIQWSVGHGYEHHCGGTLIASRVILTAAHCRSLFQNMVDVAHASFRVVVGCNDYRNPDLRCHSQEFNLNSWISHEKYTEHWKNFHHDIAVILLKKAVTLPGTNRPVTPICLPESYRYPYLGIASIVGWGNQTSLLQVTEIETLRSSECANYKSSFVKKDMICAGDKYGIRDACQGDSGGPLMALEGNSYYQIGIISGGKGCATPGWNGIYTRISSYIHWIQKQTSGYDSVQFVGEAVAEDESLWRNQRRQMQPFRCRFCS